MTKDKFLKLNIDEQIKYLNTKLSEGKTVIRIREDLCIGEKKLQKIVKENGYKYDQKKKQYIIHEVIHEVIQSKSKEKSNIIQAYTEILQDEVIHQDNRVLQDVIHVDNMKYFNENFNLFRNMLERFKEGIEHLDNTSNIIVNLKDDSHVKRNPRPVRINAFVEDDWMKFCEENKRFTKKELLSMALKEYMENHSK